MAIDYELHSVRPECGSYRLGPFPFCVEEDGASSIAHQFQFVLGDFLLVVRPDGAKCKVLPCIDTGSFEIGVIEPHVVSMVDSNADAVGFRRPLVHEPTLGCFEARGSADEISIYKVGGMVGENYCTPEAVVS